MTTRNLLRFRMPHLTYGAILCAFVGCTSSMQLVDTTVPIPGVRVDTVRVVETERVYIASACDTAAILDALCHGEISGTTDGVDWKVRYDKVAREFKILGATARTLADSVRVLVNKPATVQPLPESVREYIGTLESNQEKHDWLWFTGYTLCVVVGTVLVGVVARILLKIKGLGLKI